jgi:MoxR-like ATPase
MLKVLVDYPTVTEEFVIVERMIAGLDAIQSVLGPQHLAALQRETRGIYVDPSLIEFAVRISGATRDLEAANLKELAGYVTYGVSPRASIYMVLAAQALALLRGRDYVLPDDVQALARDVLRHRLVLSYEALGDNVTADDVLDEILAAIPPPQGGTGERQTRAVDDRTWAPPPR